MPEGYMDAAAVPVPDAGDDIERTDSCACGNPAEHGPHEDGPITGDDTLREQLIDAILDTNHNGLQCGEGADGRNPTPIPEVADALLPLIRDHAATAVQAERERVSALLASIPDRYYPQDVFGGPLSTDESRQANELLKAEGLPTFDRVGANAMRHAYRNAARMALEEPDDE